MPGAAAPRLKNDADVLAHVFKLLTEDLQAKERELRTLYDQARDRARFMEHYSDRVIESVPSAVLGFDEAGRLASSNSQAEAVLRIRQADALGRLPSDFLPPGAPLTDLLRRTLEGARPLRQAEVLWEDGGERRILEASGAPLPAGEGRPGGYVLTLEDRTPIRKLEEQAQVHQRLAALVDLSTGLAHQLRNPLSGVLGYADLLLKKSGGAGEVAEMARTIKDEGLQLKRVVDEFLEFLRQRQAAERPLRWSDLWDDLKNDLGRTLQDRGVTLEFSRDPAEAPVRLDRVSAYQALTNLVVNALEASPSGGTVGVASGPGGAEETVLEVTDPGPGIPPEIRDKVFHPFFTTKPEGRGLGLSIVQRIAQAAGGRVEVGKSPQGGASFRLRLPASAGEPQPAGPVEGGADGT
jgi:PAS domain S-box-containing protein